MLMVAYGRVHWSWPFAAAAQVRAQGQRSASPLKRAAGFADGGASHASPLVLPRRVARRHGAMHADVLEDVLRPVGAIYVKPVIGGTHLSGGAARKAAAAARWAARREPCRPRATFTQYTDY